MIEAYIEKEIKEIRYKKNFFGIKKPYEKITRIGFLVDMYAWLTMSEREMVALTDFGKWDDVTFIRNISYYSAISACKDRGEKVTFNKEDIIYFLDKLPYEDFKEIVKTIYQSRFMGKSLEEWSKENMEGTKKKSGRKISKIMQSQN